MPRWAPWAIAVVAVLVVGLELVHLAGAVQDLRQGAAALSDAAGTLGRNPESWDDQRLARAEALRQEAQRLMRSGQSAVASDPLLALLRPVPGARAQVAAIDHLASGGVAGVSAFGDVLEVAHQYRDSRTGSGAPGSRLLALMDAVTPSLDQASETLRQPLAALRADQRQPLVPPLRGAVDKGVADLGQAAVIDQLRLGFRYARLALGTDRPRTYLILLDNPAELRPAGGFAGAAGTIVLQHAAIQAFNIQNQDSFNASMKQTFPVPAPLAQHLRFFHNSLEIGDAGWDPDFPTSAALAAQMYRSSTGADVDGTISIDPYAISALLGLTGPVDVPGYGSFDQGNFFAKIDFIVNVARGPGTGKTALGPIAHAILARAFLLPIGQAAQMAGILGQQAQQRHLQLWMRDPTLAQAAASAHYDGAILQTPADYLMVSDGNVGATKSDYYLHKSASLKAELPTSGVSRHELTLTYDLPLPVDDTDRVLNPGDGSYQDYVRVYLPFSATVADVKYTVDGLPGPGSLGEVTREHGRVAVGIQFQLPRGHVGVVKLDYEVATTGGSPYELYLQKQAGIPDRPTSIEISYPGGEARRQVTMDRDSQVTVGW